ncbi:LPXTG cell wall anchor domain-containing protein [Bifidobacterium boum]|uniref:SpaA isopeptide-forming pilin-related protein n=1 Tax=Bifidobacterium boum TaxID=78343 RepID=UPI001F434386|nr:SpaA isopeptide-forming pilin-related protein [Bifidobacterium boum]MCF2561891.1 LPXTG cell wall anchor domain-containing protein [Bifidobacterium boum]
MKTSLKRFFAGVAAAAMAVGGLALGATSAQAADSDASTAKGRLTVKAAKDTTTGHTLKAYLVAAYNRGYQAYPQTDKDKPGQLNFDTFKYVVNKDDASAVVAALKDAKVVDASASDSVSVAEEGLKQLKGQSVDSTFGYKDPYKDSAKERLFADALAAKLKLGATDSAKWTPSKEPQNLTLSNGSNEFTADLNPEGLYLVVDSYTPAASNKSTQSVPMLVGTKFANTAITTQPAGVGEVDMKNTEVPVTKQVVENGDPTTPYKTPSYSLGDTVTFELSTTIPNYAGYKKNADPMAVDARKLVLTDTFEQNFYKKIPFSDPKVADDGVKLYRDGKKIDVLTKETDYTFAEKTTDDGTVNGMKFDFGELVNGNGTTANNIAWQTGDVIKVVLTATLNENAFVTDKGSEALVSGVDQLGNANSVKVDFSDNTKYGHHEVNGPTVNVYSFKFNLVKQYVKDSTTTMRLPNAQFTIKNSADKYLTFADGKWGIAAADPTASDAYDPKDTTVDSAKLKRTGIFVTDSNGEIAFNGLKADTYTVHEIKAPKGYFQNALPSFDVKIGAGWNDDTNNKAAGNATSGDQSLKNVTYKYYTNNANDLVTAKEDSPSVTVNNVTSITELPKTGAAGIAFFSVIGVAIVALAALFAVRARKAAKMA